MSMSSRAVKSCCRCWAVDAHFVRSSASAIQPTTFIEVSASALECSSGRPREIVSMKSRAAEMTCDSDAFRISETDSEQIEKAPLFYIVIDLVGHLSIDDNLVPGPSMRISQLSLSAYMPRSQWSERTQDEEESVEQSPEITEKWPAGGAAPVSMRGQKSLMPPCSIASCMIVVGSAAGAMIGGQVAALIGAAWGQAAKVTPSRNFRLLARLPHKLCAPLQSF
eukprot:COSAG04_NODE_236_length_19126_cov_8.932885_2_plen_223_part_00